MVMRVMLIGLLVIGAVAMLETDVSAFCDCFQWGCCKALTVRSGRVNLVGKDLKERAEKELKDLLGIVKKDDNIQVWLMGGTAHKRAEVREMLIQLGLRPENIGELLYEDRDLLRYMREERYMREGQMIIVTEQPEYQSK
jgi:hypothetical protein